MSSARVLESRQVYPGRVANLWVEQVVLPNGAVAELEIVRHPGAAAIVPVTDAGEVILVRQYRHAIGRFLLEVPAGKLSPGEDPRDCAARELEEEVGQRAGTLEPLGVLVPAPGFADELIHLFLATALVATVQSLDDDEVLSVERLPLLEAARQALSGAIEDSKSAVAILRAAARLLPELGPLASVGIASRPRA